MLTLPYQTTICGMYPTAQLITAVKRADLENPLPRVVTPAGNTVIDAYFIAPRDEYDHVPNFTQILNVGTEDEPKLVIDARPYMRFDRRLDTYRLTAENDYAFQCVRLALTYRLLSGDKAMFNRLGDVPVKVFTRWITLSLAQRFNLPLEAQLPMSIICAYYYYGLVYGDVEMDVEERTRLAPFVARATLAPVNNVLDIAERIGPMKKAGDLARELSTNGGTIRMGEMKYADLYTLIASSWVGINSRENVGVALEHIPTFIAMLYTAIGERSYRKTVLALRAQTAGRPADLQQFVDQTFRHISQQFK